MLQSWAGKHVAILNWRDLDHPQSGGAELYAERIAAHFASAGARVSLRSADVADRPATLERDGFTIHRAGGVFTVYPQALRWLTAHRADVDAVIDCQNGIPFFTPVVTPPHVPVVQVMHHVHQRQFRLFFGPVASLIGRNLESRGTRSVYRRRPTAAVSPSTRDDVLDELRLPGPSFLVPNGLEPAGADERAPRSPNPTIVCVGRQVPHKRLELLLEALPGVLSAEPSLTVHLVGDGPDSARLREIAARLRLDDRLVWHGRESEAERNRLVAGAWLTVNTTHGEGWGLSVLEAAALGVPALAFRVPGLCDSIRPGITGWLLDEGSPLAPGIVAALQELSTPATADGYAARCREWAGRFTWHRSAELLATILESERARLARRGRDTRRGVRESVIAELPPAAPVRLRLTDIRYDVGGRSYALLYGCTPDAAHTVLQRSGVTATWTRVAASEDLLAAVTRIAPA